MSNHQTQTSSQFSFPALVWIPFLQKGQRCRTDNNIAWSSINFMGFPQERGRRENGSLCASLWLFLCIVCTQSCETSGGPFRKRLPDPPLQLLVQLHSPELCDSLPQSRESSSPLTWPAGLVVLSQSSFYLISSGNLQKIFCYLTGVSHGNYPQNRNQ